MILSLIHYHEVGKIRTQKLNTQFIMQFFISLQSRPEADMIEFFRFENQRDPFTLAVNGVLRSGTKLNILGYMVLPQESQWLQRMGA